MRSLVVLIAMVAAVRGSLVPALLAQPAHHPAVVLDPHGRPLDTAPVIEARALHLQAKALGGHHGYAPLVHSVAPLHHTVLAAPAAVSHQSRVDVHSSPAVVATHALAPVYGGHSLYSAHHGHWLKKRSLGHLAYAAPVYAPAAVSHQARVDVHSSPALISHAYAAPVVSHAVVAAPVAYAAPAAVSHQSRVDVRTSPAVFAHAAVAPLGHLSHHGLFHSAPLYHSSPLAHAW